MDSIKLSEKSKLDFFVSFSRVPMKKGKPPEMPEFYISKINKISKLNKIRGFVVIEHGIRWKQ